VCPVSENLIKSPTFTGYLKKRVWFLFDFSVAVHPNNTDFTDPADAAFVKVRQIDNHSKYFGLGALWHFYQVADFHLNLH
jgi:hypothetical protein